VPTHQNWKYYKVEVTSIKLDVHNASEEKTDVCFNVSDEMPTTFIHFLFISILIYIQKLL